MTTPTPESAAAERLRRWNRKELLNVYVSDWEVVANAYLRELDPVPITFEFAHSVAVKRDSAATSWIQLNSECTAWLHHAFDDNWELRTDKDSSPLIKTIGEYHTYCRLFGITLKGPT